VASGFDSLVDIFPVVVMGGVLMRATDYMFPREGYSQKKKKKSTQKYSSGFGNFSNLGF
jgi:hypothetical protein